LVVDGPGCHEGPLLIVFQAVGRCPAASVSSGWRIGSGEFGEGAGQLSTGHDGCGVHSVDEDLGEEDLVE
jgi:hypothetical protein